MRSRWWQPWILVLGCLGLAAPALAQPLPATALAQPVQLRPGRRPLGAVLAELARQSRLPLSYSSSLVPLGHRYQVRPGPARPLGEVLRELLASEHLAYGLLDGQLVVWPNRITPPPGITFLNGQAQALPPAVDRTVPAASLVTSSRPAPAAASRLIARSGAATGQVAILPGRVRLTPENAPNQKVVDRAALPVGGRSAGTTKRVTSHFSIPSTGTRKLLPAGPAAPGTGQPASPAPAPTKELAFSGRQLTRRTATGAVLPGPASRTVRQFGRNVGATQAGRPPVPQPSLASRELLPLTGRPVSLTLPTPAAPPATLAGAGSPASRPAAPPLPLVKPPLRGRYLHAEAWGSESLLLGATGKVGWPRAYLVLGAALADNGRQSGPALGLGLGTAGRPRGRFTPNLDLLAWRVGTGRDREDAPILLAQLRPQLSWQVRRNGRLTLVGGPTLNLATAHQRGLQPPRWDFGRDQWLWVNRTDDESLLRLWPGVQVGARF